MSSSDQPRLGAGSVAVRLLSADGTTTEDLELRPSYAAARSLSVQFGGLVAAMRRIVDGDVEVVISIVSLGLGYGAQARRTPPDLAERVWRTGLSDEAGGLGERCVTYLRILMAGGQLPAEKQEGAGESTGGPPAGA